MRHEDNSCPVVVYVDDRRSRPRANLLIGRALRTAKARRELRLWRVRVERLDESMKVVAQRSPDAVIAPSGLHWRLAEALGPECALFDLHWLFDLSDDSRIFVDMPRAGRAFFDETGRIGVRGLGGADLFPWNRIDRLLDGFTRTFGPGATVLMPSLHGRYAVGPLAAIALQFAISYAATVCWELTKWTAAKTEAWIRETATGNLQEIDRVATREAERKRKQEEQEAARRVKTEPLDEEEEDAQEEEAEPIEVPSTQEEGREPDDEGRDFLRVLVEAVEKIKLDALWEAMLAGRVPPERTDEREEFLRWLTESGFGNEISRERLRGGMPLPPDDETGYAFLYWLWREFDQVIRESSWHKFLVNKGTPIDPPRRARAGHVGFVDGEWDALNRRLRVRFWA